MGVVALSSAFKPLTKRRTTLAIALLLLAAAAFEFCAPAAHAGLARRPVALLSPLSGGQQRGGGALFFDEGAGGLLVELAVAYHEFLGRPIAFSGAVRGTNESNATLLVAVAGANYSYNFTLITELAAGGFNASVELPPEAPAGVYVLRVDASAENKTGAAAREFYLHEGELAVDVVFSKLEQPGEYSVIGSVSFAQQRVPFAGVNLTLAGSENGFFEAAATDEGVFEQRFYAFAPGDYELSLEAWKNDYYGATRLSFSISEANATPQLQPCPCPEATSSPQPSIEVIEISPEPEPCVEPSIEASIEASPNPTPSPSPLAPLVDFNCKKTGVVVSSPADDAEFAAGESVSASGTLDAFLDKHAHNYHVFVFWGDGANSSELSLEGGEGGEGGEAPWSWSTAPSGNHAFAAPGEYAVNVVAFHGGIPGKDCANASIAVRVTSQAPSFNATQEGEFAVGQPARWTQDFVWPPGQTTTYLSVPALAENVSLPPEFSFVEASGEGGAPPGEKLLLVTAPSGFEGVLTVAYETPAPTVSQENSSPSSSLVEVSSPDGLPAGMHYENVLASAVLPSQVRSELSIKLSLLLAAGDDVEGLGLTDEEKRVLQEKGFLEKTAAFNAFDSNGDDSFDAIEWVVPRLSKRKYKIQIKILNVHSNPQLYGNWTVNFETSGTADLVVTATRDLNYSKNWTRWSDYSENESVFDLRFFEVRCGERVLPYEWVGGNCGENECSVRVRDFSCNETGFEVSKVLTARRHVLRFDFGGETAWAYNSFTDAHMILLWNNTVGSVPGGWTCISCSGGDPFFKQFVYADATYGNSGGGDYHEHTYVSELGMADQPSLSNTKPTGSAAAYSNHSHAVTSETNATTLNMPPYIDLLVIRRNANGTPATLPAGVIAFFNSTTLPTDWTRYATADGRLIRGNATKEVTGGSWTHSHTYTTGWSTTANDTTLADAPVFSVAAGVHTHDANGTASLSTTDIEAIPATAKIVLAYLNTSHALPSGMYALWNSTPAVEWTSRSASGQDFYQKFLYATNAYGVFAADNSSHTHADLSTLVGALTSGTTTFAPGGISFAGSTHAHTIYWTAFNTTSATPAYYSAILASYANAAPNVSLSSPSNGSANNPLNVNFTFTPIDDVGFKNCTTYVWYGNGTLLNNTNWNGSSSNIANNTVNGINYTFAAIGTYKWNAECWDNGDTALSNQSSENYTLDVGSACGTLTENTTLRNNVSADGTCFTIGAHNVALDCAGYNVTFANAASGSGVYDYGYENLTVANCSFVQGSVQASSYGVYVEGCLGMACSALRDGNGTMIRNNSFSSNSSDANNPSAGVYLNGVSNVTVYNDTFSVGAGAYGVWLNRSHFNRNVTNNSITLDDSQSLDGVRVYESSFNNVSNNSITVSNAKTQYAGVNLFLETPGQSCANNTVSFNSITIAPNQYYGVKLLAQAPGAVYVENTSVFNNSITVNGAMQAAGVYASQSVRYNYYFNNTVTAAGSPNPYAIRLSQESSSSVKDNKLVLTGENSYGLLLQTASSLNVSRNTIDAQGGTGGSIGIYASTVTNSNFSFNNATLARSDGKCALFEGVSAGNEFNNNSLACSGASSYGLTVQGGPSSNVFGSNNASGATGVYLATANSNNFTNNSIAATGAAAYAVQLVDADSNYFLNNTLHSAFVDFYADSNSASDTGVNNTFNSSDKPTRASFSFWGATFYVNSSNATAADPTGYSNVSKYLNVSNGTVGGSCGGSINCGAGDGDYTVCSACTQCDASAMTCGDNPTLNCGVWNGNQSGCQLAPTVCTWFPGPDMCLSSAGGCASAPMPECVQLRNAGGGCDDVGACGNNGACSSCTDQNQCDTQCGFASCSWATNVPWFFLNASYAESDLGGRDENSLLLWEYNSTGDWSQVSGSAVDAANNYVYANLTSFSVFAPLVQSAEVIDININCSSLNLGTGFAPNTANGTQADTQQCRVTVLSTTNVAVDLSVNGSDFSGGGQTLEAANVTVSNNTDGANNGSCLTELSSAFKSGACLIGGVVNYTDWVNIAKPVTDAYRYVFFFVNVPQKQPKNTYAGDVYVKAVKHS